MKENKEIEYKKKEKIDSKEIVADFKKLSKSEQEKIYYMIKGAALVSTKQAM